MSTIFNLLCPICTEVFHNDDEIYCTSCGHVLHSRCLQGWLERSTSCPQCRSPSPSTHKLYLSFDESSEAAENIDKVKTALAESELQFNGLKDDLEIKEEEIKILQNKQVELSSEYADRMELQRMESEALKENIACLEEKNLTQSTEIETLTKDLVTLKSSTDKKISELRIEITALKETPSQSLDMLATNSYSDTTIIAFENEIKKLKNDLGNSSILLAEEVSKNAQLSLEYMNLKVKCSFSKEDNGEQTILVNEKNKVLEQKLKLLTSVLEKEINKSTQLEIDNMKLQNYAECMKLNTSSPMKQPQKVKNHHLPNIRNMQKSAFTSTESINSRQEIQNNDYFESSMNSIVIQKYPAINMQYPLETVVALIATNIGIMVTKDDIHRVNIVKPKNSKPRELVSLFVRFKTKELKNKFLANKSCLTMCSVPYLRTVTIVEYIDDRAQNLLGYANMKLKAKGFNHIFLTNNQIFAKRNISDRKGIRIINCQQVDDLLRQSERPEGISYSFESLNDGSILM